MKAVRQTRTSSIPVSSRRVSSVPPKFSHYEELKGGLGRAIAYRAERYLIRDLLPEPEAKLCLGPEKYPLHDVSLHGVSIEVPEGFQALTVGEETECSIEVHGKELFQGRVSVVREDESHGSRRVALRLLTGLLDVVEIKRQGAETRLFRSLETGPKNLHSLVPTSYRDVVGRIAHFILFHRRALEEHAHSYEELGLLPEEADKEICDKLRAAWFPLRNEAAELARPTFDDPEVLKASKRYTEDMVTSLVMEAPLVNRAFTKPLGYPGDYETMVYLYENTYLGPDTFSRAFHKLMCEESLGYGVRARRDLIKEMTLAEYERFRARGENRPFRVLSLGSGPAQEVVELIHEGKIEAGTVQWTLVDQEEYALSLAYHKVCDAFFAKGQEISVRCLNLSFSQLLRGAEAIQDEGAYDFIYASGLFDYLRVTTAQALIRSLLSAIVPGGFLGIGNASGPNLNFWVLEFMVDWSLIYRSKAEVLSLGRRIAEDADIDVVSEREGAFHFLTARKHKA